MPTERIVVDGLWRCLCPSVDLVSLSRGAITIPRKRVSLASLPNTASSSSNCPSQRSFQSLRKPGPRKFVTPIGKISDTEKARKEYIKRVAKRNPWVPKGLFEDDPQADENLGIIPIRTIYEALRELQHIEDSYLSIARLADYLIRVRGEKPNANLYECLIRANVDTRWGSARAAHDLLNEMMEQKIATTPGIYEAILDVTAVHPDYLLRTTVLNEMNFRWYTLGMDAMTSVIVGLLRDGQHEFAFEKLESLYRTGKTIPPWLYTVFLYTFGEMGYYKETFAILQHQIRIYGPNQSVHAWLFLLDVFSRDGFYEGVLYIWNRMVEPGFLYPSDGVALNVLNIASKRGDVTISTKVVELLASRDKRLEMHHYEALVDAHAANQDVEKSLTVLCIMAKAGLAPDMSSTRSVFRMLRASSTMTHDAVAVLSQIKLRFDIPTAVFNVVLEAALLHDGFEVAMAFYHGIRYICGSGPDLATFKILIPHCTVSTSMDSLHAEMNLASIVPDGDLYECLVYFYSTYQGDYNPAFRYLDEMMAVTADNSTTWGDKQQRWIGRRTALALLQRCFAAEDVRAQDIITECRNRGMIIDKELRRLVAASRRNKEARQQEQLIATTSNSSHTISSIQEEENATNTGGDGALVVVLPPEEENPANNPDSTFVSSPEEQLPVMKLPQLARAAGE